MAPGLVAGTFWSYQVALLRDLRSPSLRLFCFHGLRGVLRSTLLPLGDLIEIRFRGSSAPRNQVMRR